MVNSRTRLLLFFAVVGVVAVIAGVVTALILAGRGGGGDADSATIPPRRLFLESAPASPIVELGTPIPRDTLHPVKLMFCEPLRDPSDGTKVAVIAVDGQVSYAQGTCQPDVDANGNVLVRKPDRSTNRATPAYMNAHSAPSDDIVWMPAKGTLRGAPVVMTGAYLKQDASVIFDPLGAPVLTFAMTDDGQQVFGSLSERLIGYPISIFIDGEPVRGANGHIIAPTIQSKITDSGQTTGLTLDDAKHIAALIQYGYAQ